MTQFCWVKAHAGSCCRCVTNCPCIWLLCKVSRNKRQLVYDGNNKFHSPVDFPHLFVVTTPQQKGFTGVVCWTDGGLCVRLIQMFGCVFIHAGGGLHTYCFLLSRPREIPGWRTWLWWTSSILFRRHLLIYGRPLPSSSVAPPPLPERRSLPQTRNTS